MANPVTEREASTPITLDERFLAELRSAPTLRQVGPEHLACFAGTERIEVPTGESLRYPEHGNYRFCILLAGEMVINKVDSEGGSQYATYRAPETFGETPILLGMRPFASQCVAKSDCQLLRLPEEGFWRLMAEAPSIRAAVLADCARRFQTYQAMELHREKLVSLGTLAAGLMHELNNPGTAARRSASQLRDNMSRLQQISLRLSRANLSPEQMECLAALQEQVLTLERPASFSPLEQSDREDELSEWLESMKVENPWRLAPTLVSAGWTPDDIACARSTFSAKVLSDALNYLESLISSMQHVNTIEESIARVTDLVSAVKKYAYDDKKHVRQVDVRDSLLSTLTILSHKFRHKGISVDRDLPSAETKISCVGAGLAQVWTNLLDNAIDAAPENGQIQVRLWTEGRTVCVGIRDNGGGIPPEHWDHIFEPFYTTKEAGLGTGLGLDIAHRIVIGNFHGEIHFTTGTDGTEFLVRLPIENKAPLKDAGCSVSSH